MIASQIEVMHGWGMANFARSVVYRPQSAEEVVASQCDAVRRALTIGHRGAGLSYGDAALNQGGAVLDLSRLDQILDLDTETGRVRAQAGTTLRTIWERAIAFGWWPPVVAGTMHTTLGGCVAMNVHGKNHVQAGSFGDHVEAITVVRPGEEPRQLTADRDRTSLGEVIGAQGLTGTIVDVTLRLKRVYSGMLEVRPIPVRSLDEAMERVETEISTSDYIVGWLDTFAGGTRLGRGLLHAASFLGPDHALTGKALDPAAQQLPDRVFGVFPKSATWRVLKQFTTNPGMRVINLAKYLAGRAGGTRSYFQSHAAFHFLLDYIPNWKFAYHPGGLLQYQFFVPAEAAAHVFREAIRRQQRSGVVSYLAVLKRHRADRFAARYAVDGFSLALDFPVRQSSVGALMALCREFDALRTEAGGHVYAAKDAVSRGELPATRQAVFSSNLVRRWESST
jgi:decaprenylphospho-beta-D-ribofuranose 2-oxidase